VDTMAVDARLRVAAAQPGRARLAISPYPKELEATERLRDGAVVRLRRIRPEDEPLLQDLASHMSPQDLRLRFFTAMKGLTHQLAARLTQIDYDREMALIALAVDADQILGASRFAADPDNRQAEYRVEVRSDWNGRGSLSLNDAADRHSAPASHRRAGRRSAMRTHDRAADVSGSRFHDQRRCDAGGQAASGGMISVWADPCKSRKTGRIIDSALKFAPGHPR
jgi:hypothetical protein